MDVHSLHAQLQSFSPFRLLSLQGLAAASIATMSLYDMQAARALRISLPPRLLVRNAWIANAFNNLVGLSGLTGTGIRIVLLGREKVDIGRATAFSFLIMASVPVGLAVLAWPSFLDVRSTLPGLPLPGWILWLALACFAAYLPLYVAALRRGVFSRLFRGLPRQSTDSVILLISISTLDWLLAATTAWLAMIFSGADIPWFHFLAAFVLASVLGILSLIPGSLGVFDAVLVVSLAPLSVPPEVLVSGVLLYRLCYYIVPWLIAVYLGADALTLPKHWQHSTVARRWRNSRFSSLLRLPLSLVASLGVRALGYLTFAAGAILLASAAFPALRDRLAVLYHHVPLAAIELSHFLSVVTGVLLIALSRGIAEQVRSAYYLTQGLLLGGVLFSFLKGIDYEEASSLLLIALLLRQQRAHFYRESYPLLSPHSLLWLAGLVLSVIGYAWLGDWVHGDIPLDWDRLSRFAPTLEAPRFARGLLIASAVTTAFIGWSFFRRPPALAARADPKALSEAERLLRQYGGSEFAHLLFLGDKSLLWSPDRRAFVQYGQIRDRLIALGDPCGDPASFDAAILAFRAYADRHDLTPCFYEVGQGGVHRYHDAGFALFKLGETAIVDLETFSTAGKRGESLRYSLNRARRGGAEFALLEQPLSVTVWPELRAVSDAWRSDLGAAEKGFSLGRFDEGYLRLSPIAVVRIDGHIMAFANLMPDYGGKTELSVDLMRQRPDAPPSTMDFLLVELLQYARDQGYRYFNLGMAPLGGVGASRYAHAGERVARLAYEYGNRFYNYKGLRSYKEKFQPQWRSTYLAYPQFTPLPTLLIDTAALIAGGYRRIFFPEGGPTPATATGFRRTAPPDPCTSTPRHDHPDPGTHDHT